MNNTVSNKKAVLALSLAALVSGVSSNIHANEKKVSFWVPGSALASMGLYLYKNKDNYSLTRGLAIAATVGSIARYMTKESVENFKPAGDIKKLADIKNFFTKDYLQNALAVFDDQFLGQKPSLNEVKTVTIDGKKDMLAIKPRKQGAGVIGTIHENCKPYADTIKNSAMTLSLLATFNTPDFWSNLWKAVDVKTEHIDAINNYHNTGKTETAKNTEE